MSCCQRPIMDFLTKAITSFEFNHSSIVELNKCHFLFLEMNRKGLSKKLSHVLLNAKSNVSDPPCVS